MPTRATTLARLRAVIAAQRDIMDCGLDLGCVMAVTTERARALTKATAAVFELREGDEMVYRAASGAAASTVGMRLDVNRSLSGGSVLEGRILTCTDAETDPRVDREAARKVSARSMLCVPLFHRGEAVGVLKVLSPEVGAFGDEDVSTLELMAGFISAATANAVAQQDLLRSEQRFRAVAELASDGIITADERGAIVFLNHSAARMFGYEDDALIGASMLALMPERFATQIMSVDGRLDPERAGGTVGKTLPMFGKRQSGEEFPVELSVSGWVAGEQRYFTAIVRDTTERTRLESAVLTLARTDHLTGLTNRRAGEEAIARELDRSVRYGRALSFVLLDIDHFKRINDSAGHAGGDSVLRRIGAIIASRIRTTDVAIRWGGEEFLIVLPETDLTGAQDLGEAVRNIVEQTDFEVVPRVTMSGGVATRRQGERSELAIARADERLYAAKSAGRNRVEI